MGTAAIRALQDGRAAGVFQMGLSAPWAHGIVSTNAFYVANLEALVTLQGLRYVWSNWMADMTNFDVRGKAISLKHKLHAACVSESGKMSDERAFSCWLY